MAEKLLILLIGGRTQPATLLALNHQPERIAIVASRDSESEAHQAQTLLTDLLPSSVVITPQFVDPYQPSQTATVIEVILQHNPGVQPAISLTGASMPMGIGAVELAKKHKYPAYYFNTAAGEVIDLSTEQAPDSIQLAVSVDQFLQTHDLRIAANQKPMPPYVTAEDDRAAIISRFVQQPAVTSMLLDWMRSKTDLLQLRPVQKNWPARLGNAHWMLLQELHQRGILKSLERKPKQVVSFQISGTGEAHFLNGLWLEEYIYWAAQQATIHGEPAFDSCRWRLSIVSGGAEREIDFMGIHRGVVLIASAKSGNDRWRKENIDELAAAARLLGGRYCIPLYITNAPKPAGLQNESHRFQLLEQQAKRQYTVIVTGEDLINLPAIFAAELPQPTFGLR
jgi:hypothetical protein